MPFKTRRQKEAAEKRRYILSREAIVSYQAKSERQPAVVKSDGQVKPTVKVDKYESKRITETVYTKRDLLKILELAGIIILAQGLLRLTLS